MKDLFAKVAENATYVAGFLGVIVILFVAAVLLEKTAGRKNGVKEPIFTTRKVAMIGMFSAIASILMLFEIPLPFAPFSTSWISANCRSLWEPLPLARRQE